MPQDNIDLAGIFSAVTQALASNQQSLNQADIYNQDHGDNMVQTFQTITNALNQKKGSSASAALSYASKTLAKSTTSSSGKLYAQNLAEASTQFKGKSFDAQSALSLLQTLIGGGQATQTGGDLMGTLLGGLMGGGESPSQPGGGDLLGTLLGGLAGGDTATQQSSTPGSGDLLSTLLGDLMGGGGLQSLAQVLLGGSGMGDASHRTQSTQVVINTFLQALGSLASKP